MKKFAMMMLALVMMSGCGELLEEECVADTSPKRFVHTAKRGNCDNINAINDTESIFFGVKGKQCGFFATDDTQKVEGTACTLRTEYSGFVNEDGPYAVSGTLTINCPTESCFVDVDVDVKPY